MTAVSTQGLTAAEHAAEAAEHLRALCHVARSADSATDIARAVADLKQSVVFTRTAAMYLGQSLNVLLDAGLAGSDRGGDDAALCAQWLTHVTLASTNLDIAAEFASHVTSIEAAS